MKPLVLFLFLTISTQVIAQSEVDSTGKAAISSQEENQRKAYEQGLSVVPATLNFQVAQ